MRATSNKPRNMGYICEQVSPYRISNLPPCGKVKLPRIGCRADNDEFGTVLRGEACNLIHVDSLGFGIHAISSDIVIAS